MADPTVTDQLTAVRDLLREGRTTEADKQIDTIQERIRQEQEAIKRKIPPGVPKNLAQLQLDFADTVCDLLGNPPRLTNLIVEIKGKIEAHPEQ